jgi:hypothetical protein
MNPPLHKEEMRRIGRRERSSSGMGKKKRETLVSMSPALMCSVESPTVQRSVLWKRQIPPEIVQVSVRAPGRSVTFTAEAVNVSGGVR